VSTDTLKLGNAAALGGVGLTARTADNGTTVASGATLDLSGQNNINEVIRISGTGAGGNGALVNTGGLASIGAASGSSVAAITSPTAGLNGPTISITGGGGAGATATANLGVTGTSFAIVSGTETYSVAPTVTISGGGGSGATATAVLDGSGLVTGITITAAGNGFSSAPSIAFSGGTILVAGTPPSGTGNDTNFSLLGLAITNPGSGFTSAPTVSFTTGAAPATLTASMAGVVLTGDSSIGGTGDITLNGIVSETGGARALAKVGSNTLTLANANTYTGATTVSGSGRLTVTGTVLTSSATVSATTATLELARSGGPATPVGLDVSNVGTLEIATAAQELGDISGTGTTDVKASAGLTANSIVQGSLIIGAGGSVTIRTTPVAAGGAAGANAVPEPGTWVLIASALLGWLVFRRRRSR
jgi:autotransporter-associated beta strand protein